MVTALAVGAVLRLPGWSAGTAGRGLAVLLTTAAMTVALITPLALAASVVRGYLAAVGVMFAAVFTAQIVAVLGYGQYFPYSVPALYSGIAGADQPAQESWATCWSPRSVWPASSRPRRGGATPDQSR